MMIGNWAFGLKSVKKKQEVEVRGTVDRTLCCSPQGMIKCMFTHMYNTKED